MGLRSPFGYVGQTTKFLELLLYLLDNFCVSCHTNDEYTNGCSGCNIGRLINESKAYVLSTYKGGYTPQGKTLLTKIQNELKDIEPSPMFNASIVLDKSPEDKLCLLRKLAHSFDYLERTMTLIGHKREHADEITRRVEAELVKEKRLALLHSI